MGEGVIRISSLKLKIDICDVNKLVSFVFVFCLLIFQSCIEIMDELTIHDDGSGTLKYAINLSSSRVKVNSILALDSLDGEKVPNIDEIKAKVLLFKKNFIRE